MSLIERLAPEAALVCLTREQELRHALCQLWGQNVQNTSNCDCGERAPRVYLSWRRALSAGIAGQVRVLCV